MFDFNVSTILSDEALNAVYVRKDEIPLWEKRGFEDNPKMFRIFNTPSDDISLMTKELVRAEEFGIDKIIGKEILGVYNGASALEFKVGEQIYFLYLEVKEASKFMTLEDRAVKVEGDKKDLYDPWYSDQKEYKKNFIPELIGWTFKDIILEEESITLVLEDGDKTKELKAFKNNDHFFKEEDRLGFNSFNTGFMKDYLFVLEDRTFVCDVPNWRNLPNFGD